jgi:threonine dehydrogenase-like Zn-dependent dehydrogenase
MPVGILEWMTKEVSLEASLAYTSEDFREVVEDFVAGESRQRVSEGSTNSAAGKFVGIEDMITDRIKLDDVVAKGFENLVQGDPSSIKVLVSPK